MKLIVKLVIYFSCYAILAVSCSIKEDRCSLSPNDYQLEEVLQERSSEYPFCPLQSVDRISRFNIGTQSGTLLGYSYSLNHFPVENIYNLGYPVVNTDKLFIDHPGFFNQQTRNYSIVRSSSFYDYSRVETNYAESYTSQSDFTFGIGLFNSSFRSKYEEGFSSTSILENEAIYGYMHIAFERKLFKFNVLGNVVDLIRDSYLHPDFLYMLHNLSTDQFLSSYGGYILSNYVLGGVADAYFIGQKRQSMNHTESDYEAELSATMSMGFGFNSSNTVSYQHQETEEDIVANIQMFLETNGGLPEYMITTSPTNISNCSIDLSGWCATLSDEDNLVISSIDSTSLLPIYEFIEEENVREDFIETMKVGSENRVLREPSIILTVDGGGLKISSKLELMTRRGDKILLREKDHFGFNLSADTVKMREYRLIKSYFPNIAVISIKKSLTPSQRGGAMIDPSLPIPAAEQFNGIFNLRSMKKFIDANTGKTYLLSTTLANEKYAFTFFDEGIIRDYTFDDYVDSLAVEAGVDIEDIRSDYVIIGL